jgi:hypothetical protein
MHYMPSLANLDWFSSAAKETLDRPRHGVCYVDENGRGSRGKAGPFAAIVQSVIALELE